MNGRSHFDCIVIGGGPAGLTAAAGLARAGLAVALANSTPADARVFAAATGYGPGEMRSAALFPHSATVLKNLEVWSQVAAVSSPLAAIRLVDDTGGLLRAPTVTFAAADLGLDALAFNVPNAILASALRQAAVASGVVMLPAGRATSVRCDPDVCEVLLESGARATARVLVGSDGRRSVTRKAAGISYETWSYDQAALVTIFTHSRPHRGVSTELHGPAGPCTTVPMPGRASSLVWVDRPATVAHLASLDARSFADALSTRLSGLLGDVTAEAPRQTFPLSRLLAGRMAKGRVALVGEAGHALPPIGAQGLNLGIADAAVLVDLLVGGLRSKAPGAPLAALETYATRRSADVSARAFAVDILNRTLESGIGAFNLLRGAGLHVLAASPAARRTLMERGLAPPDPLPDLMVSRPAPAAQRPMPAAPPAMRH